MLSKDIYQPQNQPQPPAGKRRNKVMADKVVVGKTSSGDKVFYKTNDGDAKPDTRQTTYTEHQQKVGHIGNTENKTTFNPSTGKFNKP